MATALREYSPEPSIRDDFWGRLSMPEDKSQLYAAIERGLPSSSFAELASLLEMDRKLLAHYALIPQTTLQRRMKSGHFNTEESDRLYRIAKMFHAAIGLFEDQKQAARWLTSPVLALNMKRPIEMAGTSVGSDTVMNVIGRLEYGVYS